MPGRAPQQSTAARLYAAARYHARVALDLAREPWDAHRALDIATRAGSAVELLTKTLLVHHDERLLTKRDAHQHLLDVVLHVAGKPSPSAFKSSNQTVDVSVAVGLVRRLSPDLERHSRSVMDVLSARNDAVHMAITRDGAALEKVLTSMSDFVDATLRALDLDPKEFWGEHTRAVRRRIDEHHAEVLLDAREVVDAAQRQYERLRSTIGPEAWQTVLPALQQRGPQERGDIYAQAACPACGNDAEVSWGLEVDVEVDDGETLYHPYYVLEALRCPVCLLHLNAEQVESLQLEDFPDVHEVAAAHEERDSERLYELWLSQ